MSVEVVVVVVEVLVLSGVVIVAEDMQCDWVVKGVQWM